MSAIIFHWTVVEGTNPGIANPHARKRLFTRWTLMAKAFNLGDKPNVYCVTNDPKAQMGDAEIVFKTFPKLQEAIEYSKKDGEHIFIEQGGTPLQDFKHPKDAVYVFGSDYAGLQVENAISIDSKLPVHAEIAAGIILADRYQQWH